jgi:hypothetical protein
LRPDLGPGPRMPFSKSRSVAARGGHIEARPETLASHAVLQEPRVGVPSANGAIVWPFDHEPRMDPHPMDLNPEWPTTSY